MTRQPSTEIRHIPLIRPDLPAFGDVAADFKEILSNGKISNFGKFLTAFEAEAGQYLGAPVVAVSSGTMGLLFALQGLGVRPGDQVVVPSFTFMATVQAILYAGARPVFADVNQRLTLDTGDLEELLAAHPETTAVIGTHVYGMPCEVDAIDSIVSHANRGRERKTAVMYDAAHAFGSAVGDRSVGCFGDAEVFSLSVTKALVAVEGGLVASRRPELIERVKHMRNYGIEANYDTWWPGLNGKMSELHAIVGRHNLRRIETILERRRTKAAYFEKAIGWHAQSKIIEVPAGIRHTFKDFTVLLPESVAARRPEIIAWLKEQGVETRAYFHPAVHQQKLFARFHHRPLPRTEALARRVLTLPFFTTIQEEEMDYAAQRLAEAESRFA